MAPSALPQTSEGLTTAAVEKQIETKTAPSLAPLDASKLVFTQNTSPQEFPASPASRALAVASSQCTDHMITAVWNSTTGWDVPELKPLGPLSLMPTASVLHYATECFEGMKVYRGYDGRIRLFRPSCNVDRLLTSATRIALPAFDLAEVEKLIAALVAKDCKKWLPAPGTFLYLRPTMIGTAAQLGVHVPKEAILFVVATFMPDLDSGAEGMKLLASANDTVRAWPGGFGYAKVGANYGPSLLAAQEAKSRGYDQVLWLLGEEAHVTEAGASNFFVVWKEKGTGNLQLVTAPLDDKVILSGVTRRSVIQLVKERLAKEGQTTLAPLEVLERKFTMYEVEQAIEQGRMVEAFACGTAYFVTPVSCINFRGTNLSIPMVRGNTGEYTAIIKNWLKNIMYGKEFHEWGVVVEETA